MITKIKNAVFITDKLESDKNLYIEDSIIKAFTEEELPFNNEIDAKGLYVSPGFIDIHTHGAGGCDFTEGTVEDILNAAYTHATYGTTTIYPTASTASFECLLRFIENTKTAMESNAPGRPHIAGSHLEAPYFSQAMRGAQNPKYIKNPQPNEYREFVKRGEGTLKRISYAPELSGAMEMCEFLNEVGVISAWAHTEAIYEDLKPFIDKGAKLATHLYSGMNTVTRRNLRRKLGAVETAYLEDDVVVETITDGVHLPPELLKLIFKIKGPDKICLVTDSVRAAAMKEGSAVLNPKKEGLACVIKDGVAYLADMTSFAGSIATSDRLVRVMHKQVGISLCDTIKMMCETPAKVMKLEGRGKIKEGYFADLVFFDDDINIKKVIIEGKALRKD